MFYPSQELQNSDLQVFRKLDLFGMMLNSTAAAILEVNF